MKEEKYKGLAIGGPNAGKHFVSSSERLTVAATNLAVTSTFDPTIGMTKLPKTEYSHHHYYHKVVYIEGKETEFFISSRVDNVFEHLIDFYQQWAPNVAHEGVMLDNVDNIKRLSPLLEQNITDDELKNLLFHLQLLRLNKGVA